MNSLNAFLSQNAIKPENEKLVVSDRFVGEDGKPIEWELKSISSEEYKKIKKDCTKKVPMPGKKGVYLPETDVDAMINKLAATCTLFPNLNDMELQDSYGVMGAEALLQKMLLPGEFAEYTEKIQEINGFNISFDEKVDEAKNS